MSQCQSVGVQGFQGGPETRIVRGLDLKYEFFPGVCNHWTGLLDSNFNALKTVFMPSDNIYLPAELHSTL